MQAGSLSRKDGERLRGRLQFAESQIAGKQANLAYRILSKRIQSGGRNLSPEVKNAMVTLKNRVVLAPPRVVCDRACYTWHLYVDALNDDDRAGIGRVLISENGSFIGHVSDFFETEVLNILNPHLSENPIFDLSVLPYGAARHGVSLLPISVLRSTWTFLGLRGWRFFMGEVAPPSDPVGGEEPSGPSTFDDPAECGSSAL